jgi:hypothetical protein
MAGMAGASQGYLDYVKQSGDREQQQAQTQRLLQMLQQSQWLQQMAEADRQRKLAAGANRVIGMEGQLNAPPPGGPQPPPPGQPSVPMMPPGAPQGGMPGMPPPGPIAPQMGQGQPAAIPPQIGAPPPAMPMGGGQPQGAPGPAAAPPQGWRPMPQAGGGGQGLKPTADMVAPPPGGAGPQGPGAGPQSPADVMPGQLFDAKTFIATLRKAGKNPAEISDALDEWMPIANANNKQVVEQYKAHNAALTAAVRAYEGAIRLRQSEDRLTETKRENEERDRDRKARTEQQKRRVDHYVNKAAGGSGNVKNRQYIQDDDGNVIGTRAITNSGKILQFDTEGKPLTAEEANVSPKEGQKEIRERTALRSELSTLQSGANPTPKDKARMEEIKAKLRDWEKTHPKGAGKSTSAPAGGKATPTAEDDAWVKAHPDAATKKAYRDRFGVDAPA